MNYLFDFSKYLKEIETMLNNESNGVCKLIIIYDDEHGKLSNNNYSVYFDDGEEIDETDKIVGYIVISNKVGIRRLLNLCTITPVVLLRMYELKDLVDDYISSVVNDIKDIMISKNEVFFDAAMDSEDLMFIKYKVFKILEIDELIDELPSTSISS